MMHYPKVTWKMCLSYSSESKECLVKLQNYSQNTSLKYSVQQHFIEYTQRQHGRPERANSKNWVILDANPVSVIFFFFLLPKYGCLTAFESQLWSEFKKYIWVYLSLKAKSVLLRPLSWAKYIKETLAVATEKERSFFLHV